MAPRKAPAKKKAKDKGGRPSTFKQSIVDAICVRLAKGEPLAAICREDAMPGVTTVWDWQKARPEVSEALARAREAGEEWLAAECLGIADDGTNDYMERTGKDGQSYEAFNSEHVQRSKLRIDTRLKLLAVFNPGKYGDKVQVSGRLTLEQLVAASHKPRGDE